MPDVRDCHLPDDLLYDVDNHTWYRELGDGTVKMGMTTVATALSGQLVAFTPRKAGRAIQPGKSCATVESGKWVGPAKSATAGEIVAVNEELVATPTLANADPYDAGWMVIIRPTDWEAVRSSLVPGHAVAGPYEAKMAADGFPGCACKT